jgi:hypothetical protein
MLGSGCLGLGIFFVLVLSIAVLVLVLECVFGNPMRPLDQPSEHRHDPFQFRFALPV